MALPDMLRRCSHDRIRDWIVDVWLSDVDGGRNEAIRDHNHVNRGTTFLVGLGQQLVCLFSTRGSTPRMDNGSCCIDQKAFCLHVVSTMPIEYGTLQVEHILDNEQRHRIPRLHHLIDLAAERFGGKVLTGVPMTSLPRREHNSKPSKPVFIADKYTDRGKWMDGWESRRKHRRGTT
ncbi:MAG: hypothetical protein R2815_08840 [Flavobacteriales bacterium]